MSINEMIAIAIKAKPRRFLTESILRSVLIQESGDLKSIFDKTDPQLRKNLSSAIKGTGWNEATILRLVTRTDGQIAKFRFEQGTYISPKFRNIDPTARFYLSSSWGISQTMGYNLMGRSNKNVASTCLAFSANEEYSILYCAGCMEDGLVRAFNSPSILKKDIKSLTFYAYCAYNSGSLLVKDKEVLKRAQDVVNRL